MSCSTIYHVVVWNNLSNPLWFYLKLRCLRKKKMLIEAQKISDPKVDAWFLITKLQRAFDNPLLKNLPYSEIQR